MPKLGNLASDGKNLLGATWIAYFLIPVVMREGWGVYLHPVKQVFSASDWTEWLASVVLVIPAMSLASQFLIFTFSVVKGKGLKAKAGQAIVVICLALIFSLLVGLLLKHAPHWVTAIFGSSLAVVVGFVLYMWSRNISVTGAEGIYTFASVWTAGFLVGAVKQKGAAYFAPLKALNSGVDVSAGEVTQLVLGASMFVLFLIFCFLTVMEAGGGIKAMGGLMFIHLTFAGVTGFATAHLPNAVTGFAGPFLAVIGALGFVLWGIQKRGSLF